MGLPCIPEPYKAATASEIEDALAAAIIAHCDAKGFGAVDIAQRYPSIRAGHLARIRRGDGLGFRMLASIAEALGLQVQISVKP